MKLPSKRVLKFILLFAMLVIFALLYSIKPEYPKIYLDETITIMGRFIRILFLFI